MPHRLRNALVQRRSCQNRNRSNRPSTRRCVDKRPSSRETRMPNARLASLRRPCTSRRARWFRRRSCTKRVLRTARNCHNAGRPSGSLGTLLIFAPPSPARASMRRQLPSCPRRPRPLRPQPSKPGDAKSCLNLSSLLSCFVRRMKKSTMNDLARRRVDLEQGFAAIVSKDGRKRGAIR